MASRLIALGGEVGAAGPVCTLEGGYDPPLLADAIVATLEGLRGDPAPAPGSEASADDRAAVGEASNALASHWRGVLG
jgi:acetoin utilization deacetylase AcuC-like enzyme